MHHSRVSAPMGWLTDHLNDGTWRMGWTGFGFNLLTGNYKFASPDDDLQRPRPNVPFLCLQPGLLTTSTVLRDGFR